MAVKYYGLCETCEHDATCRLKRSSKLKIIECEDYSNRSVERTGYTEKGEKQFQDPAEIAQLGLCANCVNVRSCGFPNARCGVLQCEKYILDEAEVIPSGQAGYSRSAA